MDKCCMKAMIVNAIPKPTIFVAAMRNIVADELPSQGFEIIHSDLNRMVFNPVISRADFGSRRDPTHLTYALEQRHNYEAKTLSADIVADIEKLTAADPIVFTFLVFWFSVPAILKGWIDPVFISGPFIADSASTARADRRGRRP